MAPVESFAGARAVARTDFSTMTIALMDEASNLDDALSMMDEESVNRAVAALLKGAVP